MKNIYTKEEIMTMYLNKFEFINGAHGTMLLPKLSFFDKPQDELTIWQKLQLWSACSKSKLVIIPVRFPAPL
ncbi:MAG: transglycosylase domain-containing protein [Saprospiraceae bacterium]|nr:transglycosylase domain-containing protein [Saprospiraceae bacterium]